MHGQVGVHDIKKKSLMRKMAPVAHLSSSSLPESVPVHEQQFEVECEFTFDHSRPPPPPSLKLSSKPESKVGWTAYYMSAAWRSDGAEWMNKWTPLLDVALAFHIALFAYLPLLRSVFLLLWSTIGTIVSIGVICCFWGGGPCSDTGGILWNMCILVQGRVILDISFHNMLFCPYHWACLCCKDTL